MNRDDDQGMVPNPAAGTNVSRREQDGDPEEDGLTAGGTGTAVGQGSDVGGAGGSGGGVVDRVDGQAGTVGGVSSGTPDTGSGMPARPPDPEE